MKNLIQGKKLNRKKKKNLIPQFWGDHNEKEGNRKGIPLMIFSLCFALSIIHDDPRNLKKVVDWEDSDLWKKAMFEEMDALDKNEPWDLVQLPARRKYVERKWLFKNKLNVEGQVEKYKSHLVAKGYSQV